MNIFYFNFFYVMIIFMIKFVATNKYISYLAVSEIQPPNHMTVLLEECRKKNDIVYIKTPIWNARVPCTSIEVHRRLVFSTAATPTFVSISESFVEQRHRICFNIEGAISNTILHKHTHTHTHTSYSALHIRYVTLSSCSLFSAQKERIFSYFSFIDVWVLNAIDGLLSCSCLSVSLCAFLRP